MVKAQDTKQPSQKKSAQGPGLEVEARYIYSNHQYLEVGKGLPNSAQKAWELLTPGNSWPKWPESSVQGT